ncbi:MAG: HAD family hydrolase [Actinomycetota bacterium]|nr:HAD family hydrolase [Actinomycetota bacterium]
MSPGPFAIVDRDGTLNVEDPGRYVLRPEEFVLLPGALEGLRRLRDLGLPIVIVTNQSPIARGWIDRAQLDEIHTKMRDVLSAGGVELEGVYVCPHEPGDGCACRKPGTELLLRTAADLGSDPSEGFLIGDKPSDIEAGRRAGMTTMLVLTGHGRHAVRASAAADHVVEDLRAAAETVATLLTRAPR